MGNINRIFRDYLIALKDIYQYFKESSDEEKRIFFRRIEKRVPYLFYEEYEYIFVKYYKKGHLPFPFFSFPPHPKYWDLIEDEWQSPFEEVMRELEREFEVDDDNNQEFSAGERQISKDVRHLSTQFIKLTETSAKLEQEVFKISFIKDLPKNVVGHITEDGTFKLVEPKTNREWSIVNLLVKNTSLKQNVKDVLENNEGYKKALIQELIQLLKDEDAIEM